MVARTVLVCGAGGRLCVCGLVIVGMTAWMVPGCDEMRT